MVAKEIAVKKYVVKLRQRPTIIESQGTEITLTDTQSDPTELER